MDREFEWAEIEPARASEIELRKGERLVGRDTGFAVRSQRFEWGDKRVGKGEAMVCVCGRNGGGE